MIKKISVILVILVNLFLIGCSQDITDKLNGTWQQKAPGEEIMTLDFQKNHSSFILNAMHQKIDFDFVVISKTENTIELSFEQYGKSISCIIRVIDDNNLAGTINGQTFYYYKLSSSLK